MKAVAIDSASSKLSVSAKNNEHKTSVIYDIGMKQSETLLPAIDYVLEKTGIKPFELDYTALCAGPGSFTGLRLGFAALKALQMSYNIPVYKISTLDIYSEPYRNLPLVVLSAIDAKKERFYAKIIKSGNVILDSGDYTVENILNSLEGLNDILICGTDNELLLSKIKILEKSKSFFTVPFNIAASDIIFDITEKLISENSILPAQDYDGPVYFRASEAEEKLKI